MYPLYFILTAGGELLVACSYASIVLCFFYALAHIKTGSRLMLGGLACTVAADYFLVVCSPAQQLWGMVFFLGAQLLYAAKLHRVSGNKMILIARVALTALIEVIAFVILGGKLDGLAIVSVAYYANLILNTVEAFTQFRKNKLFSIGLVLFILCDTVIGLQVAAGGYLPISENSLLHRIIFMDFHLSWFFYLPSQVLITLSAGKATSP